VLFSALGVSQGMAYMASIFHGVSGSRRRDRRMAIHETMLSCGIVSGPVLGGIAFERRGLAFVWWLCLAVMLAGGALQSLLCAWAVRRDRTDARDQGGPQSGIEAQ
jgi:predicted MFS family arabinose efflux permease